MTFIKPNDLKMATLLYLRNFHPSNIYLLFLVVGKQSVDTKHFPSMKLATDLIYLTDPANITVKGLSRKWKYTRISRYKKQMCSTWFITARKPSLRRLCFYTCLSFCSQGESDSGGAWSQGVWSGGVSCSRGSDPGGGGACSRGGLVRGVPGPGGRGCLVPGGVVSPSRDGYCCGRYASSWNAFLLVKYIRWRWRN